jgi:hypothetical protein
MVVPNPNAKPLEIRGEDGQLIGYIVSIEEMKRIRGQIASLKEELTIAGQIIDHYRAREEELLRTRFPLPPSPGEMATQQKTSSDIERLIAELESR